MITKMKKLIIISLGIFIAILLVVAIIGSITTGRSLDECFFGACCGILYITGRCLGFTYKEICVIVNIYLEAGLCLLSALWVTIIGNTLLVKLLLIKQHKNLVANPRNDK